VNHNIALSKELTSVEKKFEDLNITSAKRISDLVSIIDAKNEKLLRLILNHELVVHFPDSTIN
jgi:hypothetical protein